MRRSKGEQKSWRERERRAPKHEERVGGGEGRGESREGRREEREIGRGNLS